MLSWYHIVELIIGCTAGVFLVQACSAYSVGFFVGINKIEWAPERTPNRGMDRWFAWWARLGMRRGAKHR